MKKLNYKLDIEIFRSFTQNNLGVLRGSFYGFGCPKRHTDTLLAKTMTPMMEKCGRCGLSGNRGLEEVF